MARSINRRQFIGGAGFLTAAGALGMLTGCSTSGSSTGTDSSASQEGTTIDENSVDISETLEADVVVCGAGAAGLSAALEAAQNGANVVVVEKGTRLGGSTQFAEGIFGAGSSLQKQMGITGDPKTLLLQEFQFQNYKVNPKLWEQVANDSADNIDWLMDNGVEFATVAATGGDYATWHVYGGDSHGMMIITALSTAAENAGVDIHTGCAAQKILKDGDKVAGLLAQKDDDTYLKVTAPAVILATGGFASSQDMVEKLRPVNFDRINFRGCSFDTGDGIRMAQEAGGCGPTEVTLCQIGTTVQDIPLTSNITVAGAMEPMQLWVNQDAERFINEEIVKHYTRATNAVLIQKEVFAFVDSTILEKLETEGTRFGAGAYVAPGTLLTGIADDIDKAIANGNTNIFKADSFEELAEATGLDKTKLLETVDAYNAACAAGTDVDYLKSADSLVALTKAPFYAFRVISNLMNSMGGIRTDIDCQVLDSQDEPISGLYAAGMECDGYSGETYGITLPGSDQGIAVATGRVAGRKAAAYSA